MHVAEAKSEIDYTMEVYGEPTVTHLERLGVLDRNLLAVHTVWLTNEYAFLSDRTARPPATALTSSTRCG